MKQLQINIYEIGKCKLSYAFNIKNIIDVINVLKFYRALFIENDCQNIKISIIDVNDISYYLDKASIVHLCKLLYLKNLNLGDLSNMMVECKL